MFSISILGTACRHLIQLGNDSDEISYNTIEEEKMMGQIESDLYQMPNTSCEWIISGVRSNEMLVLKFEQTILNRGEESNNCNRDKLEFKIDNRSEVCLI